MAHRPPNYKLIFVAVMLAAVITYGVGLNPMKVLFSADLKAFPKTVGTWTSQEQGVAPEIQASLNADELLSRTYTNDTGDTSVGLWLVYRKYGRRDFAHRPELCYPASGWEITGKGQTTVPYGGKNIQVAKVVARKDGTSEMVLYWFASGPRTEANFAKQQLWMAFDRLRTRKYGWAFVRVNCTIADSEAETIDRIRRFLQAASGPLIDTLADASDGLPAKAPT